MNGQIKNTLYSQNCSAWRRYALHRMPFSFLQSVYLISKVRLGLLCCANSFLGTPELLSTYKAFIHSSLDHCSPLWAVSHLAHLDAVETKAFMIIGISHDEAESMGLSLRHRRQVGGLSVFHHLLSRLAPSALTMPLPPTPS